GRIYLVRDGGLVSSFDAETGKPFYETKRLGAAGSYYASPLAAAGHIYFVSLSEGVVSVIKAPSESPESAAQRELDHRVAATPAIVDDHLYIRSDQHLYCIGAAE